MTNGGTPGATESGCTDLCFLLPVGGAKLLEEETQRTKLRGLVCVLSEALKDLLVS